MNRKQRRFEAQNVMDATKKFVAVLLKDAGSAPTVAVGPIVWRIDPGHDTRTWYFAAASATGNGRFHVDSIDLPGSERSQAEQVRNALLMSLIQRRPPLIIHDFDSELALAKFCEEMWPCERTTRIRQAVEQEEKQWEDGGRSTGW